MDKQNIIIGLLVFIALLVIFIAYRIITINQRFYKKTHAKIRGLATLMFRLNKDPTNQLKLDDIDTILKGYHLDKNGWKN